VFGFTFGVISRFLPILAGGTRELIDPWTLGLKLCAVERYLDFRDRIVSARRRYDVASESIHRSREKDGEWLAGFHYLSSH
jgi:hypothetical protein